MYGIQGRTLEVTVVRCNRLRDTEFLSRQDPYVCLEYGSNRFRTRTCTDGHKNPIFQEKFVFTLYEGLREINVSVYNSNTLRGDDLIGRGRVNLQKATSQGYDDSAWPIFRESGKSAGEVHLSLRCPNLNVSTSYAPAPAIAPYVQPVAYYPQYVPPAPYPPPATYLASVVPSAPYQPPPPCPAPTPYNPYWQQPPAPGYYGQAYPPTQPPYCQHGRSTETYPPPPY